MSSEKSIMQEEMIAHISNKEKLIGVQDKCQSENQEIKVLKKQL